MTALSKAQLQGHADPRERRRFVPLGRWGRTQAVVVALAAVGSALVVDAIVAPDLSLSLVHLAATALVAWVVGRWPACLLAGFSAIATAVVEFRFNAVDTAWIAVINGVTRFAFLLGVGLLVAHTRTLLVAESLSARVDPLTGVLNRRALGERYELEAGRAERDLAPLSVIVLDVDSLKHRNDHHGHDAGDQALVALAATTLHTVRAVDAVARTGGDEFVVLLPGTDACGAERACARLRQELAVTEVGPGGPVTVSAGIATFSGACPDLAVALQTADRALYASRRAEGHRA